MANTESRNPIQPQWTETDILITCALRFDRYRYINGSGGGANCRMKR